MSIGAHSEKKDKTKGKQLLAGVKEEEDVGVSPTAPRRASTVDAPNAFAESANEFDDEGVGVLP